MTSTERVLALVAEETGYPPDMLDLDLDLEADLGIDTVKQAEVFAAIREAYGIARDDNLSCATTRRSTTSSASSASAAGIGDEVDRRARRSARARLSRRPRARWPPRRFPRRVPVPVVRPPLEHCVPTGSR